MPLQTGCAINSSAKTTIIIIIIMNNDNKPLGEKNTSKSNKPVCFQVLNPAWLSRTGSALLGWAQTLLCAAPAHPLSVTQPILHCAECGGRGQHCSAPQGLGWGSVGGY